MTNVEAEKGHYIKGEKISLDETDELVWLIKAETNLMYTLSRRLKWVNIDL